MHVEFELVGYTPLLMHKDDVELADSLEAWRKDSDNRQKSKAGDDRSPAWTWHTYLYHDGESLAMTMDNIMAMLRDSGTKIGTGKGSETYKRLTQSGLFMTSEFCEFEANGKTVPMAAIRDLKDLPFSEQSAAVQDLGFSLFVKRAKVGQAKHVRVRPRFDDWKVRGILEVLTDDISEQVIKKVFEIAGSRVGLCDWRPGSPKSPGRYGMFETNLKFVK